MSLNGTDWRLTGLWPNSSRLVKSRELNEHLRPLMPPVRASVPGCVQLDLQASGDLPDINVGLNSRQAEWVEHWEWLYTKEITIPKSFNGQRVFVNFEGLDYSGRVLLDDCELGTFRGTHIPHQYEITDVMRPGETQRLHVIFDPPPAINGQLGYTWQITEFKPRFNYIWDWVARTVTIGIWGNVSISARDHNWLRTMVVNPSLTLPNNGKIRIQYAFNEPPAETLYISWILLDRQKTVCSAEGEFETTDGNGQEFIDLPSVDPWYPNGLGDQNLYEFRTVVKDAHGRQLDERSFQIGFRDAQWLENPGAPYGARPSLLQINGKKVFLRGANWVPLSPYFGGVQLEDYEKRLCQYQAAHANILRVWGGAILEKQAFYELCDQMGIFVWQEMPLSSSGLSDYPPDDDQSMHELTQIAEHFVQSRAHHPSHLVWCGGNELAVGLDGEREGREKPIDVDHPLIAEFSRICNRWDPHKKFIPTSGHGPRAFAKEEDYGKGLHHDVHGPWAYLGPRAHYEYYNGDDSLWRSEVGVPGSTSLRLMEANHGGFSPWPADASSRLWLHHGSWWINADSMEELFGPWDESDTTQLRDYLQLSRWLQGEGYRYVVEACRRRAYTCGLVTIWMGHDCYWTTANNSVIEYDGSPKPAYSYLQRSWAPLKLSLQHSNLYLAPNAAHRLVIWQHQDEGYELPEAATAAVWVRDLRGNVLHKQPLQLKTEKAPSQEIGFLDLQLPIQEEGLVFVEVSLEADEGTLRDVYIFGQDDEHVMQGLRRLPRPELRVASCPHTNGTQFKVSNTGPAAAIMTEIMPTTGRSDILVTNSASVVFPGQEAEIYASAGSDKEWLVTALNYAKRLSGRKN